MPEPQLGRSVLVVEDDDTIRETTALLLETRGYAVRGARDGRQALAELRGRPVDLVVLDLWMPNMDGWQFRLRQGQDPALAAIPVLVLSAVADISRRTGTLPGVSFLQKPADPQDLFAAVARLTGGP